MRTRLQTPDLGLKWAQIYSNWMAAITVVDHYSDNIQLEPSQNTSASTVKQATKRNFAWHLIPDECITDKGLQFNSYEYSCFTREYGFTTIKSSPYHSRRNGKAKSTVQLQKKILKKSCFKALCLALFKYQNTPQQHLMSWKLQDIIPTADSQLDPHTVSSRVVWRNNSERINKSNTLSNKRAFFFSLESSQRGIRSTLNVGLQLSH